MDTELMEEFIEACRQTRALTDDILLLKDTKPAKPAKTAPRRRSMKKARGRK
jgi:hypothetical protein